MTDDASRSPSDRLGARPLSDFPVRTPCLTRWSDNDMYGHLNNAVYYELFDTAINGWIASVTGGDFAATQVIGVVAESSCRFHSELAFPGTLTVGMRVHRLGRSSVTYTLGVFAGEAPDEDVLASATGQWVHVYLDRRSRSTTPIPPTLRAALTSLDAGRQTAQSS